MEHHCLTVVLTSPNTEPVHKHFYSSHEVGMYISRLPLAWGYTVQIFCDKQEESKITKLGDPIK